MGKTAKKSIFASLACALVLCAAPVQAEEDSILKAGAAPGTFDFQGTKTAARTVATVTPPTSGTGDSLRLMGLWLTLFGAGVGTLVLWYRKRHMPAKAGKPTKKLQIVERIALGHRREVVLIKACDRLLVVASHAEQTTLLSDLASDDIEAATPAFDNLYSRDGLKTNERILKAEAEVRTHVAATAAAAAAKVKAAVSSPIPQPWPEMEKA